MVVVALEISKESERERERELFENMLFGTRNLFVSTEKPACK